jgi:hypothetical protein
MALSEFTKDMEIVSKLSDEPNLDGGVGHPTGYTAEELKAVFDEGGISLKTYINNTLVPYVNGENIDTAHLVDGSVTTDKIEDGAVTSAKIGAKEVKNVNIDDAAVDTLQLADGSVTTQKLAYRAVAAQNIADGAVTESALDAVVLEALDEAYAAYKKPSSGIPSGDIADGAVTLMKLAADIRYSIANVPMWVTYGELNSTILKANFNNGSRLILCSYQKELYAMVGVASGDALFVSLNNEAIKYIVVDGSTWTQGSLTLGTYRKPTGGIPQSDLASDVQTSLGKADTALQEHQSLAPYRTAAAQDIIDSGKLDVNQGQANAGRPMVVGQNGYLSPGSFPEGTYIAAYGSDTPTSINEALLAGKNVVMHYGSRWYALNNGEAVLPGTTIGAFIFTTVDDDGMLYWAKCETAQSGNWTNGSIDLTSGGFGYGTCTTPEATPEKTASISNYTLTTGGIVAIKFENNVPANSTLNISSKGAKAIYYKGRAINDGDIKAGDTVTMVYSTYYHVLSTDRWDGDIVQLKRDITILQSGKIGMEDAAVLVTMTASGNSVTCFKGFAGIYALFNTQQKSYFILVKSQTDYQMFNIDRVDGGNQTIYLSSVVGGVLSQIVLTPSGTSTMTGTLTTIDLNLQNAQGVSF